MRKQLKTIVLALLLLFCIAGTIVAALIPPIIFKRIVDDLTNELSITLAVALVYFLCVVLAGIFESLQNILIVVAGQHISNDIRVRMSEKLNRVESSYFVRNETGTITSLFVNDVDSIEALFTNGIVSMIVDAFKVISVLIMVFTMSLGVGFMILAAVPIVFFVTRFMQKRMLKVHIANREAISKVNNHIPETISNIRMIKNLHKENYMEEKYDEYIIESYESIDRSNLYDSVYSPIIVVLECIITAVLMMFAAMGGRYSLLFGVSVGSAAAVITYVSKVFGPLESIGMEIQNIQSALAGIKRIKAFFAVDELHPANITLASEDFENGIAVEFEHVDFAYEDGRPVLKNLSFTVEEGENVTLVGRTGAGKSTAFKLILGLYEAGNGQVKIYGRPAAKINSQSKRKLLGYVEQQFVPCMGSVADQISLAGKNISEEEIKAACRLVGINDVIEALPKGYNTVYSENDFSMGQKQLLSIARAVVLNPRILLLDEITANLDSETEEKVLKALASATENRTVISISHRLYEKSGKGRLIEVENRSEQ